jgi:hypothetical protein
MTPETRSSTHFFWNYLHDFDIDNPNIALSLRGSLEEGFNEDKDIIEAQQKVFDADPNYQLLAIGADAALTYFRWLLGRKIEAEKGRRTRRVTDRAAAAIAAAPFCDRGLLRRDHHDLDIVLRRRQPGLDGGAGRRVAGRDPAVPHRVHLGKRRHVGDVDRRGQQFRLVGAGLGQMAVDDGKDVLGLLGDALALGVARDDAREIDGIAVHDHLAHAGAGFKTLNAHTVLQ